MAVPRQKNKIHNQRGGTCKFFACLNSLEAQTGLNFSSRKVYEYISRHQIDAPGDLMAIRLFNKLKIHPFAGYKLKAFSTIYNSGSLLSRIFSKKNTLARIDDAMVVKEKSVLFALYASPDGYPLDKSFRLQKRRTSPTGGHLVYVAGSFYDDNREEYVFKIENSWGPEWGDHGFFYIPESELFDQVGNAYILEWQLT